MKQIKFLFIGLAGILFGCQQMEISNPTDSVAVKMKTVTISAGKDAVDTKAAIDSETGAFSWQSGDQISVLATDGKFYDFVLEGDSGRRTAEFVGNIPETAEVTTVATYPRTVIGGSDNTILENNTLNYSLPSELTYAEGVSNVPMVATFEEGATEIHFKQIGGVMRFPVKNLPAEGSFVVTMNDKTITGSFPVDLTTLGESCITAGNGASQLVINYSSEIEGGYAEFNVPVPVGVYNDFNVSVKDAAGRVVFSRDYSAENKVERATLLNMSEREIDPQFSMFSIKGVTADNLYEEFIDVRLPYGTDVKKLVPVFSSAGNTVCVNGVEQVSGVTEVDFSNPVEYSIFTEDGEEYKYIVSISYSDIPVVYINTKDAAPIVSKSKWLEETEMYITNAGEYNKFYTSSIRGRGNTTWNYPKKPYAIKLDSKEEVLGMPKHKRWVLLANYVDKTCIRNSVAFEIAKRSSALDWTPRGQHVDVVLNGVFMGNYYLCEQIKGDKNRVNKPDDGYLIEIDKNFDEVSKFYSPIRNMPFMLKEPDEEEITPESFAYIQNRVTEIENALYGDGSTTEGYLPYIDLDSFIDYWMVYELTSTGEPTHPKSVYMWTDNEGKFHAGPVWDFDYYTYQPYYNNMLINTNAVWNDRIINDPNNRAAIKARWEESREKYRTIAAEIDRQYERIRESAEYNASLWPVDPIYYMQNNKDPNREKDLTVEQSVERMKGFYEKHFEYMDSYINSL